LNPIAAEYPCSAWPGDDEATSWPVTTVLPGVATRIEGAVDRYVAMTRATQQLVNLT
jgi:hypothetical protein